MKKVLIVALFSVLAVMAFAVEYSWDSAPICGNKTGTDDTTFVNAPGYGLLYGVAVAGNGRVWSASMYAAQRYRMAIMVYDPEFGLLDTVGPEIVGADGVADTLGTARFFETTIEGNIAYGDWTNDKIRVFDQDTYECIAESPGVEINVGGGMAAFAYDGEQYYCSQEILGSKVILYDADFNSVDTLKGGGGGRNMACTPDGTKIWSPSLGGKYIVEWKGNPDDGYVTDTLTFEDLGLEIGNVMYISRGPNDYLWVFSRDTDPNGIYVLDPEDNYSIKMSTVYDESYNSIDDIEMGMAYAEQWEFWAKNGKIDSSEVFTTLGYHQPWILRAPTQVAYDYDGTTEYLYLAEFYGHTLKLWTREGKVGTWEQAGIVGPKGFTLDLAYPNPFNPTATIPYTISNNGVVDINVFDLSGKKVESLVNEFQSAGSYEVVFNGSNLSSGNYLVEMTFGDETITRKISLLK